MRVAIVDGYYLATLLPSRLRRRGIESVHVASRLRSEASAPTIPSDDYVHDLGVAANDQSLTQELRRLGVTRVLAGSESGIALGARLGALVGGPHDDPSLAEASADKAVMAQIAEAAGITIPRGAVVHDAAGAVDWVREHDLAEVVAKPISSAATDGVRVCRTPDELTKACAAILTQRNVHDEPNTKILVQERVWGREFYINTMSGPGGHEVVEVAEYTKEVTPIGAPIYRRATFVTRETPDWQTVVGFARRLLDSLGIRSSPAHTEVMLRPDGSPVLIETCARLGGACIPDLDLEIFGFSQLDIFVDSVANGGAVISCDGTDPGLHVTKVFLVNTTPGTANATWPDTVRQIPGYRGLIVETSPGQPLPATTSLLDSPGVAYLAHQDPAVIESSIERLRAMERHGLYLRAS